MTVLDIEDGFSIQDYRHGLKLLTEDGDTTVVANRDGFGCPACEAEFERLLVASRDTVSFSSAPEGPVCVARTPEQLLVLTH